MVPLKSHKHATRLSMGISLILLVPTVSGCKQESGGELRRAEKRLEAENEEHLYSW